jgi:curli biogenesis system outer membrane secretion channel CsgG
MKRNIVVLIMLASALSVSAVNIERTLRISVEDLAKQYMASTDVLLSKKTVTIVGIKNISDKARNNFVGEGIAEILKSIIHNSLVFSYVDRDLLEQALEEIELALSDITSAGSQVEIGRIEAVNLLLTGSVAEEREDFLVSLQACRRRNHLDSGNITSTDTAGCPDRGRKQNRL